MDCVIARIVDGDTIWCMVGGKRVKVRFIGIDTPEPAQRPFGPLATKAFEAMAAVGDTIQLEPDLQSHDRYGRYLAYLWRRGRLLNLELVRGGWAVPYTVPPNVQHADWFEDAARIAREQKRGLWNTGGFDCTPSDYRGGRC